QGAFFVIGIKTLYQQVDFRMDGQRKIRFRLVALVASYHGLDERVELSSPSMLPQIVQGSTYANISVDKTFVVVRVTNKRLVFSNLRDNRDVWLFRKIFLFRRLP